MESAKENRIARPSAVGLQARPPVVVVMGHIDHGKSTLLDYIRKTNVAEGEVGGITQYISAYEVVHKSDVGEEKKITFLDTPGHEAFSKMRARGAEVADIAILVVSAEDGVKPQTIEAAKTILSSSTPFIVAINKIDKPGANIEKTKGELAEHEIYLEDYGGKVPFALISGKTGEGVENLLGLILILAELEGFTGNPTRGAEGAVIETNLDPRRGIQATLIIKDGTLKKGMTVAAEEAICGTRIMENFQGEPIEAATFSSPIRLVGFDQMPRIGSAFHSFEKKSEAEKYAKTSGSSRSDLENSKRSDLSQPTSEMTKKVIPIVLKADTYGSLEAIEKEIEKIKSQNENLNAELKIVSFGIGAIGEGDVKSVSGDAIVIGFNVKADRSASEVAEKRGIAISFFDIIYKMSEWLAAEVEKRRPRIETEESAGRAKILKTFSRTKERQIIGGKVMEGRIKLEGSIKILRREFEIGRGKIINLEKNKAKVSEAEEGSEFGMLIESKIEIVPGDMIESFSLVQK